MSIRTLIALGVVASAGLANLSPAIAAETGQRTAEVQYRDLDLSSGDGVATLHQRIEAAVHRVCGLADPRDLVQLGRSLECERAANASATSKVREAMIVGGNHPQYASLPTTKAPVAGD